MLDEAAQMFGCVLQVDVATYPPFLIEDVDLAGRNLVVGDPGEGVGYSEIGLAREDDDLVPVPGEGGQCFDRIRIGLEVAEHRVPVEVTSPGPET